MLFESNYGIVQVTSGINSLRFRIRATCFRNSVCHPLTTHDHLMSHHYYLLYYYINYNLNLKLRQPVYKCDSNF